MIPSRYLTVCDGGVYQCVAMHQDGRVLHRNFSLTYGSELLWSFRTKMKSTKVQTLGAYITLLQRTFELFICVHIE